MQQDQNAFSTTHPHFDVLGDTALSFHLGGRLDWAISTHTLCDSCLWQVAQHWPTLEFLPNSDIYLLAGRYLPISTGPWSGDFSECAFQCVIRSAFVMHGYC